MKKGILYQFHNEIQNWKEEGSVLFEFNKLHIAAFYKQNQKALDAILTELKGIQEKYIVHENGKLKMHDLTTPVYKVCVTHKMYEDAYMQIMQADIPVEKVTKVKRLKPQVNAEA